MAGDLPLIYAISVQGQQGYYTTRDGMVEVHICGRTKAAVVRNSPVEVLALLLAQELCNEALGKGW